MWVLPEIRNPACQHAPTRKSISYFGAVRIADSRLVTFKPERRFDAQTCWHFLRRLQRFTRRRRRKVIVIVNYAKYHHATLHFDWRRSRHPDFVLLFISPYRRQLNPIERVWKLLRRLWRQNRFFPTLFELVEIVEMQFTAWARQNPMLRRLCSV